MQFIRMISLGVCATLFITRRKLEHMQRIYLDNAATSFPKPEGVSARMRYYLDEVGASVNRSVYAEAADAGLVTLALRERLCRLLGLSDPAHCILTSGATAAINMALKGTLQPGDHCIVSFLEHNAVMRPLVQLEKTGVRFDRIPCDADGRMQIDALEKMFRPDTRLIAVTHASNVFGTLQPVEEICRIAKQHGVPVLLDGAQTAGHFPIHFERMGLSALAVPAHKGLLGPSGIGALLLSPAFADELTPLFAGGTGSYSDSEELPPILPDRLESGTPNIPGIYGWEAALAFIEKQGIQHFRAHERMLTMRFLDGVKALPHVRIIGPLSSEERVGVISLDFVGRDNAEIAFALEKEFGILTRCGLHCAPNAHKALNTFPQGTVRFSFGWATTEAEIDAAINAVKELTAGK